MKHFLLFALGLGWLPLAARAQSVGIGTAAPDPKAALEIKAADKGLLVPRLSETARQAITNPPQGLLVFQRDGAQPGFWYATGSGNLWLYLPDAATAHDNLGDGVAHSALNLNGNKLLGGTAASPSPDGLQVDGSGRVGVGLGSATPAEQLQVDGGHLKIGLARWTTSANDRYLKFGDGDYATLGETGGDDLLQFRAKDFRFNASGVSGYTGNVGIGLGTGTAATERLEVAGSIKMSGTAGTDGLVFPDGTRQTTAVSTSGGLTLPYSSSASTSGNVFSITNSGTGIGVRGASASGQGVVGRVNGTGAGQGVVGVKGTTIPNIEDAGVVGLSEADYAVYGRSSQSTGVVGVSDGTAANLAGVQGSSTASSGVGVLGTAAGTGVRGVGTSGAGVDGTSSANANTTGGVVGRNTSSPNGVGVLGLTANGYGVRGVASASNGYGVQGIATDSYGVIGSSTSGPGTYGGSTSSYGVQGNSGSSSGVYGNSGAGSAAEAGVKGTNTSGNGVLGQATTGSGVRGEATGSGIGVVGQASGSGRAGYFAQTSASASTPAVEITQAGTGPALKLTGGVTTSTTGPANMMPVAYGCVNYEGNRVSGTTNWTVTQVSQGYYRITFTSPDLAGKVLLDNIMQVTPYGFLWNNTPILWSASVVRYTFPTDNPLPTPAGSLDVIVTWGRGDEANQGTNNVGIPPRLHQYFNFSFVLYNP